MSGIIVKPSTLKYLELFNSFCKYFFMSLVSFSFSITDKNSTLFGNSGCQYNIELYS